MRLKRLLAFTFDMFLITIISQLISLVIPTNDLTNMQNALTDISEKVLNNSISLREYISNFIYINYIIDKNNIVYLAINVLLIFLYFIALPLFNKNRTFGLQIFNLEIKKANLKGLLIRTIFVNGSIYMLLNIILIHILNYKAYFISISILGFIQILLVIISVFMIIYRKDQRGLQDVFSQTKIIKRGV